MKTTISIIIRISICFLVVIGCSNDDGNDVMQADDGGGQEMPLGSITLNALGVDNTLVRIDDTLTWEPFQGNNIQYQVFLGTSLQNMEEIAQTSDNSFPLATELEVGTDYFWRVTATEGTDMIAESDQGSFKTEYIAPRLLLENAAFSPRRQANTVSFNGRLWHMGGANEANPTGLSEIWSSANGTDWVQEPITGLEAEQIQDYIAVVFNGRLWLSGQSQLYSSPDGINWTRESDPPFRHFGSISMTVFNSRLWRFSGFNGTITGEPTTEDNIYSSANGTDWELGADPHGFFSESRISVVPFNDVLFGMEQNTFDGVSNTVLWTSSTGAAWEEISRSELGFFGFRTQMIAFQNSLIIVAGGNLDTYYRSSDGMVWEPATTRDVNTQLFLKNFAELNGTLYAVGGGGVNSGEEGNAVWVFN